MNKSEYMERREIIFISFLIVSFQMIGIFPGRLDISDLFFVTIVPLWLILIFTRKNYQIVGSSLNYLNLALLSIGILSVINGGLASINTMLSLIKAMLFSFLIIDIVRRKECVVYFMKTLIVVTTFSAIVGILQEIIFLKTGVIFAAYDKRNIGLILEQTSMGTFLRVPAFTKMHLFLANYLVLSLLIVFNAFLYLWNSLKGKDKKWLTISMVITGIALILTFSKTNFIGLGVGILFSVLIKWPPYFIHISLLLLLFMVFAYLGGFVHIFYESIISEMQLLGDTGLRLELMRGGIEGFFNKYPFIGAGLGQGKKYTQDAIGWGAHNAFVLAADDVGIFGLLIFCSIFLYGALRLIFAIFIARDPEEKAILKTLLVGLIALLINIQFQPDFLSYYNWIYIGFVESAVIVIRKRSKMFQQESMAMVS